VAFTAATAAARLSCVSGGAAHRAVFQSIAHFVVGLIVYISTFALFCHLTSPLCKVKTFTVGD
jgi:hypothetical protein